MIALNIGDKIDFCGILSTTANESGLLTSKESLAKIKIPIGTRYIVGKLNESELLFSPCKLKKIET